jgi:hypothetical protein
VEDGESSWSLYSTTPNFLLDLVALSHFIRANSALPGAVWQEIRVRSGRDDDKVWMALPVTA